MFQTIKSFVQKHERHIGTAALFVGAAFDWLTITKPDSLFGSISLTTYLVIAGGSILLLNARSAREKESVWLVILLQFCFGNLASGLLVLYSQSGTLVGSWLFLLVLAGFLIGNEFARSRYLRLRSQLIGYFVLLSAYAGFIVPVVLKEVGVNIFLLSSALSIAFMVGYVALVYAAAPSRVRGDWKGALVGIVITSAIFNGLYFLNFIPPVPLSLTEVGVYHDVVRTDTTYKVTGEKEFKWYDPRAYRTQTIHLGAGEGVFCFSSVYAPVGLTTPIYHRFEQYDVASKSWKTRSRIAFPINGGRDEGYRGYSFKASLSDGSWRCSIETEEGALIGRKTFNVSVGSYVPLLVTQFR
ncbi:DUF2914 domain-containing protein [Patescibacteria group bacterium]|nr:DUF2914 domain-containing protein [Patescibacteria group bacterium]